MPAIALPPAPMAIMVRVERPYHFARSVAEGAAEGWEGRLVLQNRFAALRTWLDRSEYLHRQEEATDELPAVPQMPIVRTVRTRFFNAGPLQPLPFPDSDD